MADLTFRSSRLAPCAAFVLACLILSTGCESDGGYSGPTGEVSGTATLAGSPAPEGCRVTFVSSAGFTASGEVGAGGAYELSVMGKDGSRTSDVPVGNYDVSVTPPGSSSGSEEMGADYDAMMDATAEGRGQAAETQAAVIPAKYQSAGTSGLSYEVKDGDNSIEIAME